MQQFFYTGSRLWPLVTSGGSQAIAGPTPAVSTARPQGFDYLTCYGITTLLGSKNFFYLSVIFGSVDITSQSGCSRFLVTYFQLIINTYKVERIHT